jgi:hypothetical protein
MATVRVMKIDNSAFSVIKNKLQNVQISQKEIIEMSRQVLFL